MPFDPFTLMCLLIAVTLLGLGKGGFAGLGVLAVPVLVFAFPPTQAAAILLPLMVIQDVFGVWAFRHSWNRAIVAWMVPGALLGVVIAALVAAHVSHTAIIGVLGVISILFGAWRLKQLRGKAVVLPVHAPPWVGTVAGVFAGITSQIAHAGSPPFQMYVSPKRLPHTEYVGTSSVFFAILNWSKVPAFWALGEFTPETLRIVMTMVPVAVVTTLVGVWLIRRIRAERFYVMIDVLLVGLGAELVWSALR
ncbi:sulfite exporter TauE/SafE family protein [Sphingobium subterraneum]|uniref:Probable membrane transporter protein n=1 Tax=Sphingobium subterraneum TaxID=627688 RepID=A0A841J771_9SPHN|nr:sulfite exporter TauE/SafE family protein [Sphingobium subterraneum]MBB6124398.1 hypothetical protein [Sphingobium subterraneum]